MKTPLTILCIATAAHAIGGASCFQLLPPSSSTSTSSNTAALRAIQNHDCSDAVIDDIISPSSSTTILSDESPQSLGPKRTFLGMRRESGVMRRMMMQEQQSSQVSLAQKYSTSRGVGLSTTTTASSSTTALSSSATALMPDGGLSPCVIKVLGVGGGGSNAVRVCVFHYLFYCVSRLCFVYILAFVNSTLNLISPLLFCYLIFLTH